ncbi:hypothetical protein LIER_05499 [Lithospermum erythrorhizon]|uniref:Uncharacterized protein n=1 Tax=Lithospermum erythrorhizon TaxID=34254 RepID=A0AAV3P2C1_LITER
MDTDQSLNTRMQLNRTLIGIIRDVEYFSAERIQIYVDSCWLLRGVVNVERRGSLYFFHFTIEEDLDDVVLRSPLNINGALLILYENIFRACYHCGRIGRSILQCRQTTEGALFNNLEHVHNNNQDQHQYIFTDYDTPLYDPRIHVFPNSEPYINTTIHLFDPLENSDDNNLSDHDPEPAEDIHSPPSPPPSIDTQDIYHHNPRDNSPPSNESNQVVPTLDIQSSPQNTPQTNLINQPHLNHNTNPQRTQPTYTQNILHPTPKRPQPPNPHNPNFNILPLQPDLTEEEIEQLFTEQTELATQRSIQEHDPFPQPITQICQLMRMLSGFASMKTSDNDSEPIDGLGLFNFSSSSESDRETIPAFEDTNWLSMASDFNPIFYAGFIMCKTPIFISIVVGNVQEWNKEVEDKIGIFTGTAQEKALTLDNEIVTILAKVQSFYTTLCKVNWNTGQSLLNNVGFFILVELILNQSHFRIGQINDWTEEIGVVERSKVFIGEKKSRIMLEDLLKNENLILVGEGVRKKQCFPEPLEAALSNWMEKLEEEEEEL